MKLLGLVVPALFLFACSGGSDYEVQDGPDGAVVEPAALCASPPSRFVVLGDSISACFGVGGKDATTCGPKILHSYLDSEHVPGLVYENRAVEGAVTTDVPDRQVGVVDTGPGHAIVLVYVGGNDLQTYLLQPDDAAIAGLASVLPGITEDWESMIAFFDDTANFPDGATIIMNNQYNPFDDCTAAPYNLSPTKITLLNDYNSELARIAESHKNVVITDQHTPYLGHGHHYNVESCPHYEPGLEPFMNDLIHPNEAGHGHLATQWEQVANDLFDSCE